MILWEVQGENEPNAVSVSFLDRLPAVFFVKQYLESFFHPYSMDRQSALATLKKEGYKLRDMPQYMNDKELVLAAVKDYGLSLKHASPALQANRQVVMAAVKNNGMAIDHASPALKKDKAIIKTAKAQEKALDDAMTKKYFKKGGRTRRTRV